MEREEFDRRPYVVLLIILVGQILTKRITGAWYLSEDFIDRHQVRVFVFLYLLWY